MPCPKNRNARVFNIPLKSEKTVLVSQLICVSHISFTAIIAEKIQHVHVLKSESAKCLQKYLA